ncbi:MAG TPA: M28 family peptidase [Isosphaeraceae bacterium]|jgi:hypothetical protein|nr:M28 family peptidase [Isosphaeraceae bacterium]
MALLLAAPALAAAVRQRPKAPELSEDRKEAIGRISADSLRGHLSFLASDLLEGRDTPSRGLDLAAEYIAAQFRRAGLEPIGDDGYFQTARWRLAAPDPSSFSLEFRAGDETVRVPADRIRPLRNLGSGKLELGPLGVFKVVAGDPKAFDDLETEQVEGKAVVVELEDPTGLEPSKRMAAARAVVRAFEQLDKLKAALIVGVGRDPEGGTGLGNGRLIDPENPRGRGGRAVGAAGPPAVVVHDPAAVRMLDALPGGKTEGTVALKLGAPVEREVKLRNVVGLLRGSDPALRDTYVLVTAHYDHIGIRAPVKGDKIYNGANDDGSGTVSVVELASALATLKERPRRSIVFATFFGEEHGLLGSRYYARHPAVPVEKTVADVNLEQLGRTDDSEGPRVAGTSMTGFDYSDVGAIFKAAGEAEGIKVDKHPRNSDAYFGASDNQALADLGVPAHTICVAFAFPDYHGAGDHWDKVDFANMARVDRMVARALLMIADDPEPPKWDAANPKAKRYREAYEKLHSR